MSDLLALATFHLYAFYTIATAAFRFHTQAMRSLFHIFRGEYYRIAPRYQGLTIIIGKKYNTLRDRVEPSEYDLDQLLVGSVLFTLAAFLFPTVLAYYLLFASVCRPCFSRIETSTDGVFWIEPPMHHPDSRFSRRHPGLPEPFPVIQLDATTQRPG